MAVVTGKDRRGLDSALAHHGFSRFFHSLQTPDNNPQQASAGHGLDRQPRDRDRGARHR